MTLLPNGLDFVAQFGQYSFFAALVAPLVGGETAILAFSVLAAQSDISIWSIIAGSGIGMIALDSFWFFIPRTRWAEKLKVKGRGSEKYRKLEARIEAVSGRSDLLIFFIMKVMVGTRILVLTYLSLRNISFKRFFFYNTLANITWTIMLCYIGYGAGMGFYTVTEASYDLRLGGVVLVAVAAAYYGALWAIRKWIAKT